MRCEIKGCERRAEMDRKVSTDVGEPVVIMVCWEHDQVSVIINKETIHGERIVA